MTEAETRKKNQKSRRQGARFEAKLDKAFAWYRKQQIAVITKTPEPVRNLGKLGNGGMFKAVYTAKAQPDYKGVVKGGRAVLFEAKSTANDRIDQSRVTDEQIRYMEDCAWLGAKCFILVYFAETERVYRIPLNTWKHMKEIYGRKYLKESDIKDLECPQTDGKLIIFPESKGAK